MTVRHGIKSAFFGIRAESIFAAAMLAAACFGLVKVLLLASIMPAATFGAYISALGAATVLAMLVSIGDTESTYKSYPQLLATGRDGEMFASMADVRRRFLKRIVGVLLLAVTATLVFSPFELTALEVGATVVVAYVFAIQMLMTSVIRAVSAERVLPKFTAARGLSSLLATGAVAVMTESWVAVLLAEGVAQVFVFVVTALRLRRKFDALGHGTRACDDAVLPDHSIGAARLVYFATITSALVPHGGRSAIVVLDGPAVAGAYGVLFVLVQVAQMLAGSLSQKLGPALMREAVLRGDEARMGWMQRFGLPVLFLWTASALVFTCATLSFLLPSAAAFWDGYGITIPILAITAIQMAMSVHLYLFFAVISENREADLVRTAVASVAVFYLGVAVSSQQGAGLLGYTLSAAAADATKTIYLLVRYRRMLRSNA